MLLAESVTLAAAGTVIGLAIAHITVALLGRVLPAAAPLSAAAWTFAPEEALVAGIALAAGILSALWPAWQAYRLDVAATLADT